MNDLIKQNAPALNTLQLAWLQEIGLDKRMLARYAADSGRSVAVRAPAAVPVTAVPEPRINEQPGATESTQAQSLGIPQASGASGRSADVQTAAAESSVSVPIPHVWEALQHHIAACEACGLQTARSQIVFGTGAVESPEWLLVGEAPGEHDDRVGLPFQGKPGVLLEAMLASIGVPASTVFFTNLIKCRPLGNRTPRPEEIASCLPYLRRQIALLKPRRILALGKLAAQALLETDTDFEALRGRVHHIYSESGQAIPLVVTYHPAALLIRPQHKADAWQDLNLARAVAGAEVALNGQPAH